MKKLPIIRHFRWLYWSMKFNWYWETQGKYLGAFPNQSDLDYLQGVWDGKL